MSKASAIFNWTRLLAPLILSNIAATRPLAGHIAGMLDQAEALTDAKGADKLRYVLELSHSVGDSINQERPGTVDLDALDGALSGGISVAFQIAQVVAAAHGAPVVPPAVPIVPGAIVVPPAAVP